MSIESYSRPQKDKKIKVPAKILTNYDSYDSTLGHGNQLPIQLASTQ